MYLVTAATDFEMQPFLENFSGQRTRALITGVGPVETAVRLMTFLHESASGIRGVVNLGVAGAYMDEAGVPGAGLLDICLAETEVLGDLGVCLGDAIERIQGKGLEAPGFFVLDAELRQQATQALEQSEIPFRAGNFVTVSCATGTTARGVMLARQHSGLCENMEGAAVARVCREFNLPCLEIRCISNLVEDRDPSRWKLKPACKLSGEAAAVVVRYLVDGK